MVLCMLFKKAENHSGRLTQCRQKDNSSTIRQEYSLKHTPVKKIFCLKLLKELDIGNGQRYRIPIIYNSRKTQLK